ncbi:MAG: SDR family oxidoreductase [Candidatus Limnocylindria bacterium]
MTAAGLFDLSGRVAIVLGGSRGIGRELACGLASAGARVAVAGRTASDLEGCAAEIRAAGGEADAFVQDATRIEDLPAFLAEVVDRAGGIDVFVHVAGMNRRRPAVDVTEDDWDAVLDLNLKTFFFGCQAVGRNWIETGRFAAEAGRGKGKMIGIGSLTSTIGLAKMAPYAASKAGLLGVTRVLAVEWAPHGICVNALAPGYIETEFTRPVREDPARNAWILSRIPMARWGRPADLVGAALFLASSASDYVTGQVIHVDGGWLAA